MASRISFTRMSSLMFEETLGGGGGEGQVLDAACPLMRLQQWKLYCHRNKISMKGKTIKLAETAFGRLTNAGAWEKCAREGVADGSLEKTLQVHNPFLPKQRRYSQQIPF